MFQGIIWIYHILFIHSSAGGNVGYFHVGTVINNAIMNIYVQVSAWTYVLCFLGCIPRSRIGHEILLCLTFWGTTILQSGCKILHSHLLWNIWKFWFLHTLTDTCYYIFFITATMMYVKCYLTVVFICISLITNDVEHLCMHLLAICISSWKRYLSPKPILNWVISLFIVQL